VSDEAERSRVLDHRARALAEARRIASDRSISAEFDAAGGAVFVGRGEPLRLLCESFGFRFAPRSSRPEDGQRVYLTAAKVRRLADGAGGQ
jgi:hypothetical protein